jgi:hypothetical protein
MRITVTKKALSGRKSAIEIWDFRKLHKMNQWEHWNSPSKIEVSWSWISGYGAWMKPLWIGFLKDFSGHTEKNCSSTKWPCIRLKISSSKSELFSQSFKINPQNFWPYLVVLLVHLVECVPFCEMSHYPSPCSTARHVEAQEFKDPVSFPCNMDFSI